MSRNATEKKAPGRLPLAAVFLAAFLVRLVVARELTPLALWTTPQLDARENLVWATRLAAGDFRWPSPPTHGPAYPYLLAALLELCGGSLPAVRVAHAAIGGCTAVLLALLGSRLFGRRAGLAAGFLLALSGPVAFVDVSLWEEVLLLPLVVLALLLLVARPARLSAALAGLLLGLASASRPTALLYVLGTAAAIPFLRGWPRRGLSALALVAAAGLVLAPAVVASSRAAGRFVFVRSLGTINLWIGNDPAGGGVQNARPNGAWDRLAGEPYREGVAPGGEEGYFLRKTLARAAADPAGLARVLLSKAVWLTQAEEPRDNQSYAFFRAHSLLLRLLPGFGLLAALAAVGFVRTVRQRSVPVLPLVFLAAGALPALAVLAGLRYRLPVVPLVALFSGLGAAFLFETARARRFSALWPHAALAGAVLVLTHLRTHAPSHVFAEELSLEGNSLMEEGKSSEASAAFRKAAEADPRAGLPVELLARLRQKEGRLVEARDLFVRSLALDPDSRTAHFFLARTEEALGDGDAAIAEYRLANAISPLFLPARYRLGQLLLARGDAEGAARELEFAVAAAPSEADPLLTLAEARAAEGKKTEAVTLARRGAALAPRRIDAWLILGSLAAEAGDVPALREALGRARSLATGESPPLELLEAKCQRLEGHANESYATLARLLRRHPESALARQALLAAAHDAGREDEARALLDSLGSR
ncbi:MAG: tetratricopeptide repeat protein [Acidithiobacillales bacterium]